MTDKLNSPAVYVIGSPCKINKIDKIICGRYIGDSNISSPGDNILLIGTPGNSIIHAKQSTVSFDLTFEDIQTLKIFEEDAISCGEWYHSNRDPKILEEIGIFMDHEYISPIELTTNNQSL